MDERVGGVMYSAELRAWACVGILLTILEKEINMSLRSEFRMLPATPGCRQYLELR